MRLGNSNRNPEHKQVPKKVFLYLYFLYFQISLNPPKYIFLAINKQNMVCFVLKILD
jgi:hypothetical protein